MRRQDYRDSRLNLESLLLVAASHRVLRFLTPPYRSAIPLHGPNARAHCGLESPPPWLDTAQWSARHSPQPWQEVLALDFRLASDLDRLRQATRTGRRFAPGYWHAARRGMMFLHGRRGADGQKGSPLTVRP